MKRENDKLLRVAVDAVLLAERDGRPLQLRCRQLSTGGMVVASAEAWEKGTQVELKELRWGNTRYEILTTAEVLGRDDTAGELELSFIELGAIARANVEAAFADAVAPLIADHHGESLAMRFSWAFRDAVQLAQVCSALLSHVDLPDAWTEGGPSDPARASMADAADLTPAQAAMMKIVWSLWRGSLDVTAHAAELPDFARASLEALKKAIPRGPNGVDEWLAVER